MALRRPDPNFENYRVETLTGCVAGLFLGIDNTCKIENHVLDGHNRTLFVHRKGATRSFGPCHPDLPPGLRDIGQPVLIGGTMGTESYVLVGTEEGERLAFSSACHGAGRSMSRTQATKHWRGRQLVDDLRERGVLIRTRSYRGVAEEAPGAYKDVKRRCRSGRVRTPRASRGPPRSNRLRKGLTFLTSSISRAAQVAK